ncbi:DNA primase [Desulfovibrio ferrophilus]|uniref:DNA primase n=1 Tax=Desulfovibrio ferrophilus TaxID=241368 RepID=A0A2Z6AX04_9BACT|nr:DNA primase [Desulfovibrio ferrophilus]BBD07784.1 DNA primase [Desulfovibrio ferrophilus]
MGKVDSGAIGAIKQRLDIVELVRRFVDLRQVSGRWSGPCPFHQETKPSFSVNPEMGYYYCFGCRASGDVIDFYCNIHGLEFREGLQQLAEEVGVELSTARPDPQRDEKKRKRSRSLKLHEQAAEFYIRNLNAPSGKIAGDYLVQRKLSDEVIKSFSLGYSPDDWHGFEKFAQAKGFQPKEAVQAGLLVQNEKGNIYDRFRGRLMFPIHNLSGQVIAFGARTLTGDDPKYLNSSESPIYVKGDHLYGLFQARRTIAHLKEALLTEGYTDVLSLHQFGFSNACGVLGTALTESQVRRLAGFCSQVALVFDGDGAGRKAALRSSEMILARGMNCRVVILPDGEDVDSLLHAKGADAFRQLLDAAPDGLEYCLRIVSEKSTREVVEWASNFLKQLDSPEWRSPLISRIALRLGFKEVEFREKLVSGVRERSETARPVQSGGLAARDRGQKLDRQLLRFAVCNPHRVGELADLGMGDLLGSEFAMCLWEKMAANPGKDVMHILAPHEKRYWVECLETSTKKQEDADREFHEICDHLKREHLSDERAATFEALRKAQTDGDATEVQRLLGVQQEILRRLNEQR